MVKVKKIQLHFLLFQILVFSIEPAAQWVNNPAENTRVVYDLGNPINISTTSDQNGGAFIFWQDNISGLQNEVRFMHIESNGNISFRADGKRISEGTDDQNNPVSVLTDNNNAIVAWTNFSTNGKGDLLVQKVHTNGSMLWNRDGIKINSFKKEISEYSICSNKRDEVFVSYLAKESGQVFSSLLMFQKLTANGITVFDSSGITVSASMSSKLTPAVISDDSTGAYVFWIESPAGKGIILSQHYDGNGSSLWGPKPLSVTDKNLNVITFSAIKSGTDIYVVYQILKSKKTIYHQLISSNGKMLWGRNGKMCTNSSGMQSNPQMIASGTEMILSWTNERDQDRDIYVQKYNRKGDPLWKRGGIPVIKMAGDQFGQRLISDDHKGAIIAWLDRRTASMFGNIYSQRISSAGKIMWDSSGIAIGSYFNTPKSYLSLLPDGRGSAIAVFKEKRKNENGIYVQKIFNTGTFVSQIIGFSTEVVSDSVKISWYSANETPQSDYNIERSIQTDTGNTSWQTLRSIISDTGKTASFYEYYDKPDTSGTLYYRIILTNSSGEVQSSEISRVTFLESARYIIVTQNTPNPFSDSTVIKFYLPEESDVKIEFFDNHIEKIDEINDRFPAGENSVTFTVENRQPGIYFYKFECGDFVEVKKMVMTD